MQDLYRYVDITQKHTRPPSMDQLPVTGHREQTRIALEMARRAGQAPKPDGEAPRMPPIVPVAS